MSEVIGLNSLLQKLRRLSSDSVCREIVVQGAHKGTKLVQAEAKILAPANSGELRQKILTRANLKGSMAVGEVFVNVEHGIYVELGTGPKGATSHSGISPEISVSYRSTPWYVHESQIDVGPYHFQKIGEFYKMYGQPAQPYLYPALKNNETKVQQVIANHVKKKISEYAK